MTWPCYIENRVIMRRVIMRLNCKGIFFYWCKEKGDIDLEYFAIQVVKTEKAICYK